MIVAVAAAAGWALLCHATKTGAPWTLAVAGIAVGATARAAARARGGRVQLAAGLALLVFFALGEFLIYRHALLPRLEAMHRAEGFLDSEIRAEEELEQIRREPERYAAIEATRDLFLAMAAGIAAALWITRPRHAVAAFTRPSPDVGGDPPDSRGYGGQALPSKDVGGDSPDVPGYGGQGPVSDPSSAPSSSPEPPPPSAPASPGSDPPSAGSPGGS
jgi:hypothetical protein